MNERWSVNFFKRAISITVLIVILGLLIGVAYNVTKLRKLSYGLTTSEGNITSTSEYQNKYKNLLITDKPEVAKNIESKVVYLTFNDELSVREARRVLEVLDKYNVKATFFVSHADSRAAKNLIKREIKDGHSVGILGYSPEDSSMYDSVDSYLKDFNRMYNYLEDEFSYKATIFRFPGGSINMNNYNIYKELVSEMNRRGFTFYDWNVSVNDGTFAYVNSSKIVNTVMSQIKKNERSIVLLSNSAQADSTIQALPNIIKKLKNQGYKIEALDNTVLPITFSQ